MTDFPILQNLGYILFTAAVAVLVLRPLRVPTIVAYMAAGLVLGPITRLLTLTPPVELISEVGIALLLFLVGLELKLEKIRGVGRVALVGGTIQIVGTAAAGLLMATAFGFDAAAAAVIALAATFSSTVVVVKLLDQTRELGSLHGRISVGILLVQDVAVVLALTLFAGLQTGDAGAGAGAVLRGVALAFGGMLALAAAAAAAAKWLLPQLFRSVRRSPETVFIWALAWRFLFIVAAELVHLSVELGAFIAGVSIAQLHFAEDLHRRVQPIVNFFLVVFFVSLGVQMNPGAALTQWPLVLALLGTVLLIKPAVLLIAMPRLGFGPRTTFMTSLTLAQMSEFSFILAALAASVGVLAESVLSVITLAGFISIGVSSYLMLGADAVFRWLQERGWLSFLPQRRHDEKVGMGALSGHIIVVGMNTLGVRLVRELAQRGENVLAIDTDGRKLFGLPARKLLGNVDDSALLEEAHFTHAKLVISALQIEDANSLLAFRCRAAGVPAAIHAYDAALIDELRTIGADHIIVSKYDGTREIALRLRAAGVLD